MTIIKFWKADNFAMWYAQENTFKCSNKQLNKC